MLLDERLDTSWQCALTAQKPIVTWAASKAVWAAGKGRDFHPVLWRDPIWNTASTSADGGPQHRKDMDLLEQVQRRPTKMIRGMKHLSLRDKAERTGIVQPGKKKALG